MINSRNRKIKEIIKEYNTVIKVMDTDASNNNEGRAYGGVVRSAKGKLQEYITEELIKIAWESIGGETDRLEINSNKIKVPININYVKKSISNNKVKEYILENIDNYYYGLRIDKHIFIDNKFVAGIECKSYTENAMLKRILVDFYLLKEQYPDLSCYLFQLESMLGGDYSEINKIEYGSHSTHTLLSYFDNVDLNIITFIKGERDIDSPLHKYFKPLESKQLVYAVNLLAKDLEKYV